MGAIEHGIVGLLLVSSIAGIFFWARADRIRYRKLVATTALATLVLIVLGAFVRLSDAGLGCPDWPGCYGNLSPHHSLAEIKAVEASNPHGPVSMAKAWKEMVHRYLAMVVGSLIASIMLVAWYRRRAWAHSPLLPTLTAALVIFQAALGAWTVTLLLRPAVVTLHLIGGITILALLVWQLFHQSQGGKWTAGIIASSGMRVFALLALATLFMQIMLGGWVSTNYAALACSDLPTCHGVWLPSMDFANAFHVVRPLGLGPDGKLLTLDALTAIHWAHRLGAVLTTVIVGTFAWRLLGFESGRHAARVLFALLAIQLVLGLSNVLLGLPLAVAVSHNGVAAIMFSWLLVVNLRLAK